MRAPHLGIETFYCVSDSPFLKYVQLLNRLDFYSLVSLLEAVREWEHLLPILQSYL